MSTAAAPRTATAPRRRGAAPARLPLTVIEPRRKGVRAQVGELWRYRGLVAYLSARLMMKTYARTVLGRIWVPLRPVLTVAPQILIYGGILGAPSEGIPYPLFFIAGITFWHFFSRLLYWITRSVELNRSMVRRFYYPRLAMPLAALAPSALQGSMYGLMTVIAFGYYWIQDGHLYLELGPGLLLIPAGLVLMAGVAYGLGLWFAVLGAYGRDIRFTLSSILGFWYLVTPVIYPLSAVPAQYRWIAEINPLTAPVEMIKLGLFGVGSVPQLGLLTCAVAVTFGLASGLWFFGRAADLSIERL
jgi:lipopolysaccharide transport system permease protein